MIDTITNHSRKSKPLDDDTIMLGETAMVGFNKKMREISRAKNHRRRFGGLFLMKNRSGSFRSDDHSLSPENHDENVRKIVDNKETFRKMQETLRESKFSTNQGLKHALVKYFQ